MLRGIQTSNQRRRVPLHRIPNICFGKVSTRHKTNLFLPALYQSSSKRKQKVSQQHLALIYDDCIRPAILEVAPARLSHWPATYELAFRRASDDNHHLHYNSIEISPERMQRFCSILLQKLDMHPQFEGAFFYHEWRGLKEGTAHNGATGAEVDRAWDMLLIDLRRDDIVLKDWYVDVGMEIYSRGKVLHWWKDAHEQLLKFLMPDLPDDKITGIQARREWKTDVAALLYPLAGFRTSVSPSYRGSREIAYLNVYTTDKESTYQLHTGVFRRRKAIEILPKTATQLLRDLRDIADTFGACKEERQEGCARVEIRIRIDQAKEMMRRFPTALASETVLVLDAEDWWCVDLA